MSEKFPSQMQDKFTVRFPDGMRDAVAERAKQNCRSMNSEIIQIIDDALSVKAPPAKNKQLTVNEIYEKLLNIAERIEEIEKLGKKKPT